MRLMNRILQRRKIRGKTIVSRNHGFLLRRQGENILLRFAFLNGTKKLRGSIDTDRRLFRFVDMCRLRVLRLRMLLLLRLLLLR